MNVVQLQGQGNLSVRQKSDMILDAIFGDGDLEPFSVFNNGKENTGKVYLTIHTPLTNLVNANLPFIWTHEVGEEQVVIHF